MDISQLTPIEQQLCIVFSLRQKEEGNLCMSLKRYHQAIHHYSKAIRISSHTDSSFYTNRALAFIKLGQNYQQVLRDLDQAELVLLNYEGTFGTDRKECHGGRSHQTTTTTTTTDSDHQLSDRKQYIERKLKIVTIRAQCLFELARYIEASEQANIILTYLHQEDCIVKYSMNKDKKLMVSDTWKKSVANFTKIQELCHMRMSEFNLITANGQYKRNFVEEFSECQELVECIFSYMCPPDLLRCAAVCTNWRQIATNNYFWKPFCEKRWMGKQTIQFQSVLMKSQSNPIFDWRRRFYEAEHEANRVKITVEELSKIGFSLVMPHMHNHSTKARFHSNFTMEFQGMRMDWKFVDLGYKIQVSEYPPLKVSRDKNNWGWVLTNDYAVLRSETFDP